MIITVDGPAAAGKGTLSQNLAKKYGLAYFDTGMVYRAIGVMMLHSGRNLSDAVYAERLAGELTFAKMMALAEDKEFRSAKGVIYDGRDTGTVICPQATVKFFITAKPEVRAKRRFDEFAAKGQNTDFETVLKDVKARDERDATRKDAPMKPADDAYILDTSDMGIDEVFQKAVAIIEEKVR